MPINSEKIKLLAQAWDRILKCEEVTLKSNLSELQISALSSWVEDCFQSYKEIYTDNLEKIKNATLDDYDLIHDCVVDIFWQLDHIKNHIIDAEQGFSEFMNLLARKAEDREKKVDCPQPFRLLICMECINYQSISVLV